MEFIAKGQHLIKYNLLKVKRKKVYKKKYRDVLMMEKLKRKLCNQYMHSILFNVNAALTHVKKEYMRFIFLWKFSSFTRQINLELGCGT